MIAAEVKLWGTRIGVIAQRDNAIPVFSYDKNFISMSRDAGIEPSPIAMPVKSGAYSFPELNEKTFHGLPGMLADSLPDKFGTAVFKNYLAAQGKSADNISAIERLLYTGTRGSGALEFFPAYESGVDDSPIDISSLVSLAGEVLSKREGVRVRAGSREMRQLFESGSSVGGARAKAVIAWNRAAGDIRSGQINAGEGYRYYIIKLDAVLGNGDRDVKDGKAYTRIEYAYYRMATAAGIIMSPCELYEESCDGFTRYHFITKRFDRTDSGEKLHMQSLGALAHLDFNSPWAASYEQAAAIMNKLSLGAADREQLFRRMVFNVIAENNDDHVKNISFLMNKAGEWLYAPAYDITFAYNPESLWLRAHQMTVLGKARDITDEDLLASAKVMGIRSARARNILQEVIAAVYEWPRFAEEAYVPGREALAIEQQILRGRGGRVREQFQGLGGILAGRDDFDGIDT